MSEQSPEYDPSKVVVVFVLGGPGVGKGTHCASLVRDYGFVHLSAGDLLRAEQARPGSEYGQMIADYIKEGKIVPMEVTISLLRNAIQSALETHKNSSSDGWGAGKGRFLIDGFPRKLDQSFKFEESVCPAQMVLFLQCTEEVMLERLLHRGETSGRSDDNIESIKKRFRTFVETSMPVVDYQRTQNKVVDVNAMNTVEQVYKDICDAMNAKFQQIQK
ncbi:bifunctional uridylate/adenylate kinase [Malassezia pachydermatis]|uniref:Uridylate kinase n=1 Tax=Malassezia pachydermatis TaxID=77020 RepID=A0A0M8MJE4_9BASI|nr:uridylate kinase [Malassezia pachydermatis]KOS12738.1 uridylate kinase [Malassezia pachydermatis]